jgi:protease-4
LEILWSRQNQQARDFLSEKAWVLDGCESSKFGWVGVCANTIFCVAGKPLVGYMPVGGEKEYYLACACKELYAPPGAYISLLGLKVQAQFLGGVLEKVGIEPQVQRIGKYKSAGDQLSRKEMSEANREMLTALLDDIYANFLQKISSSTGY